jgi:dihydroxy-acid dehydratase
VLSAVRPNGAVRIEQFEDAGGARGILKQLAGRIDTNAMTCTGKTLGENLAGYEVEDPEIIRPIDRPLAQGPSIAILKGSLATTAVVRLGIRDGSRPEEFEGPARVFETTDACIKALREGDVKAGDVIVCRGQGLKGGPAMGGGASLVLFAIDAAGLSKTTAFVTDGQLSGLCLKGLTVAEVAPESEDGGPIGKVRDGDRIVISVERRGLDVDVPAEEWAARQGPQDFAIPATGYLNVFRHAVQPMSTGGVLLPAEEV